MAYKTKDLLDKFKKLILGENIKREIIKETILEIAKINIDTEDITLKDQIIYLNIKPIYKNEIFLKRKKIIEKIQEQLDLKLDFFN